MLHIYTIYTWYVTYTCINIHVHILQALSNGIYKSIKHRVVASQAERFSAAYFYCPTNDAIIESLTEEPPIYRHFTFREYQRQNQKDVQDIGDKIGLKRFLLYPEYDEHKYFN